MVFTAPDGTTFEKKTEYRDYMFEKFLSVRRRKGEEVVKKSGDVAGCVLRATPRGCASAPPCASATPI